MSAPRGLPEKIWVVTRPNGERHLVYKNPLEGDMEAWAKGLDVVIVEYAFSKVTHTPPPKKKATSK